MSAPFSVVSISPPNYETGVAVDTTVAITFNQSVDMGTVSETTFNMGLTGGSFAYDSGTYTVTYTPPADLNEGEIYSVNLTTGLHSGDATALEAAFVSVFATVGVWSTPDNPGLTTNLSTLQDMFEAVIAKLEALTGTVTVPDPSTSALPLTEIAAITASAVSASAAFSLPTLTEGTVSGIATTASDIPTFGVSDPPLDIPTDALPSMPDAPGSAPTISDVTPPDSPTLPTVADLTLASMTIPTAPDLVDITFSVASPTFAAELPSVDLDWREDAYQSSLADALRTILINSLTGTNGLSTTAEAAAFNLTDEEEKYALKVQIETTLDELASLGFPLIGGTEAFTLSQIANDYGNKKTDASRKLADRQMQLEQQNIEEAIKDIITLDTRYFQEASERANRMLQAIQYQNESAYKLFTAQAEVYNAKVSKYEADASVYGAKIKAVTALVEKYRAQVEGATAQAEGNVVLADYYAAQITYLATAAKKYQADMESRAAQLTVDRARLQGYAASISGFQATIEGKTAELTAWLAQVESVKAEAQAAAAIAFADAQKAEADKVAAMETAEAARVNFAARQAQADMNIQLHESARAEAEAATVAVKNATEANRREAERIHAETQTKVTDIETAIQENRLAIITADAALKQTIEAEHKTAQIAINNLELDSAANTSQEEMNARLAAAAALAERFSTNYNANHSKENVQAAQRISLLSAGYS